MRPWERPLRLKHWSACDRKRCREEAAAKGCRYQRLLNFSRRISPSSRCCSRTAAAAAPPRSSFWASRLLHQRGEGVAIELQEFDLPTRCPARVLDANKAVTKQTQTHPKPNPPSSLDADLLRLPPPPLVGLLPCRPGSCCICIGVCQLASQQLI